MFSSNNKPSASYGRSMNRPNMYSNDFPQDYGFAGEFYAPYANFRQHPSQNRGSQNHQGFTQNFQQFRDLREKPRDKQNSNNRRYLDRDPRESRGRSKENRQFKERGRDREKEQASSNTNSSAQHTEYKLYTCPSCQCQYECFPKSGRYVCKVPLILTCQHVLCQECIVKSAQNSNVVCPTCNTPSVLPSSYSNNDIQELFPPNFYLFGLISWCRTQGNNIRDLTLVPVQQKPLNRRIELELTPESGEKCCFLNCNRKAKLRCQDCNDIYCDICCTYVHNSAKSLWSHKQVSLSNGDFFVELEKCKEHNMDSEIYCKTCDEGACCYCFLEKHDGHEKDYLSKLSESDQAEFVTCRENAEHILRQLLYTQKKLQDLQQYSTSAAEKKITNYFVSLYSKLQSIEKNLRKEVASTIHDTSKHAKGLDNINSKIVHTIENVKKVLIACESADLKKVNLKEIYNKLKEIQNVPCYLLNDQNDDLEPVYFSVDPILEHLESYFQIKKSKEAEYVLVSEEQLPSEYKKSEIIDSDIESTVVSLKKIASVKKKKADNKNVVADYLKITDKEMVEVTHIESLEKFYVQLKKAQFRLLQMNKEIENYAKMATPVEQPQLNDLYLVLYINKNEKSWCRGRITDVKNGETEPLYEIFFIDYGTTQTVNISKLREITPALAQKKSFAIQCELYNPTYVTWSKTAHVYMGKVINGKDIYMMVKSVQSGIHQVDLMVSSSDRGLTSVIDILIHTCKNALNTSSDDSVDGAAVSTGPSYHYSHETKIFANSMTFQKNQIEKVILANVVDPHHIWVNIAAHTNCLKKMINDMKVFYKKSSNTFLPVEGSYVVVENRDPVRGNWHRALIKKVDLCTQQVHVKCLDWGTNLVVPFDNIRMLTENFTRLESQAVFIKLAHIEPYGRAHIWSDKATIFLQNKFRQQEVLKMIVYNDDPLEVALFEEQPSVDICLNAMLVAEKLADSTGKLSKTLEWPTNDAAPPTFAQGESLVESLLKKVDESCEEEDTEDEEDKNLYKQKISVVRFVSPDLIYIKFVAHEKSEHDLLHELQVHYNKERKLKDTWTPNEMCVLFYNKLYARGKIISQEGDKYKVNVIDNADEVIVPQKKLFLYAPYFTKYKSVVYKAHLANIRPAGGNTWSLSSIESLEKIFDTHKENIFATKITDDGAKKTMPMKMWYTQVKIGGALEASVIRYISINNFLVKLGFAYRQISAISAPESKASDSETSEDLLNLSKTSTDSKDWNKIMEEEEVSMKSKKKMEKSHQDSPYRTREAEIKDWKPAFLIKKQEFNAWITCAETEGILYLREESLQDVYKELEKNLQEYFDNKLDHEVTLNHTWQPGQMCTIAYNNHWYRGKVNRVDSPDEINVIMIDFGSDHNVKPSDLYREVLFPEIEAFASKVKLDRIYPKSGKWLTSDYETLLEIVTEYGRVEVKSFEDENLPLAEVYNDKGVSVNDTLVSRCPNLTRSEHFEEQHSDDDNVVIEEEEALELKGPAIDTTGFKFKIEELPKENKSAMFILTILGFDKVVLKKPSLEVNVKLTKLSADIQKYEPYQPVIQEIKLNMPCIARYSEDGLWYRGQVYDIDGLSGGYILVYYIDFGNVESVLITEVKMMKPEWFDLPASCHIAKLNFKMKTDNHLEYIFQHIRKLFGKSKTVEFVNRDPLTVNLFEENGEFSYQTLIKSGFIEIGDTKNSDEQAS